MMKDTRSRSSAGVVAYPAVLDNTMNDGNEYTVTFPDIVGAVTQGYNIPQAVHNGTEALGLVLFDEKELPIPSDLKKIQKEYPDTVVTLIGTDLNEIAKRVRTPVVKKNTTLPTDLAEAAEKK